MFILRRELGDIDTKKEKEVLIERKVAKDAKRKGEIDRKM